jgi:hypothetical protein
MTFGKRNSPNDPALSHRPLDRARKPSTIWNREIPALLWIPAILIVAAVLVLRIVSGA